MNRVQMKTPLGRLRDGDVPRMNRIECAAKKCDRAAMLSTRRLVSQRAASTLLPMRSRFAS